eukprot:COSAG05_NODE_152_length_15898_cov_21.995000_9_plen_72_part_00
MRKVQKPQLEQPRCPAVSADTTTYNQPPKLKLLVALQQPFCYHPAALEYKALVSAPVTFALANARPRAAGP